MTIAMTKRHEKFRFWIFQKLGTWPRTIAERSTSTKIAFLLLFAAIVSGIATYAALNETPPFGDNPNIVIWLLNLDLIILLLLVGLIARRIAKIYSNSRQGIVGSRLHVRLVMVFSILTATPAILMAVFSAFFFHFGVQTWFSERVETAVTKAQAVAEAYLEENTQSIRGDMLLMVQDINKNIDYIIDNKTSLESFLEAQSFVRNFSEIVVFDGSRRVIGSAGLTFSLAFENLIETLPEGVMDQAREGEVIVMTGEGDGRVRAIVELNHFNDTFLFVGRMIDPVVLSYLDQTKDASQQYALLQGQFSGLQITVTMIFVMVALILLMAAIWFGIVLARQLINPISALITTADRVRAGDLTARVPETDQIEEFEFLGKSFNKMTSQIQDQRDELVNTNRQLDERRRFTEAVLSGVSAGIIGIDTKGLVTIANTSANDLFSQFHPEGILGKSIHSIAPDVSNMLEDAKTKPGKITQGEIIFETAPSTKRMLLVRIAVEQAGDKDMGAVLTFDDITELQSAQRKAAWADVARRIAHEIKNPLTPIQLSAERLKRKYLKEIKTDPEIFSQCTDTIVKHVEDIGRMVSEFSSFARMPEPVMRQENIVVHILDMVTLQRQAHPEISFSLSGFLSGNKECFAECDAQQFRQALTNLILNAIDSVEAKSKEDPKSLKEIHLSLSSLDDNQFYILAVSDSGKGFPEGEDIEKLTEPYITHKEKGTGLGLAIVSKIMEDHKGRLILGTNELVSLNAHAKDLGGATVSLMLPIAQTPKKQEVSSMKAA